MFRQSLSGADISSLSAGSLPVAARKSSMPLTSAGKLSGHWNQATVALSFRRCRVSSRRAASTPTFPRTSASNTTTTRRACHAMREIRNHALLVDSCAAGIRNLSDHTPPTPHAVDRHGNGERSLCRLGKRGAPEGERLQRTLRDPDRRGNIGQHVAVIWGGKYARLPRPGGARYLLWLTGLDVRMISPRNPIRTRSPSPGEVFGSRIPP